MPPRWASPVPEDIQQRVCVSSFPASASKTQSSQAREVDTRMRAKCTRPEGQISEHLAACKADAAAASEAGLKGPQSSDFAAPRHEPEMSPPMAPILRHFLTTGGNGIQKRDHQQGPKTDPRSPQNDAHNQAQSGAAKKPQGHAKIGINMRTADFSRKHRNNKLSM